MNTKRNIKRILSVSCLLVLAVMTSEVSSQTAQSVNADEGRIDRFIYHPAKIYKIQSRVGSFTNIEVPPGEQIEGFYLSDTTFWRFVVAKDLSRVMVKPGEAGVTNSGTLITNKRVYELSFVSVPNGQPWQQKVQWDEAKEEKLAWGVFEPAFRSSFGANGADVAPAASAPTSKAAAAEQSAADDGVMVDARRVNFAWQIEGDAPFRPITVFDDGRFTYVRLPNVQDMPALFAEDAGKLRVIDYAVKGDTLIVHRVSDALLLRLDNQSVRVTRRGSRAQ